MGVWDARFLETVVAEGRLVAAESYAGGAGVVVGGGVFREGAPAAADIEEGVAGFESDFLADDGQFVVLQLFEGFFGCYGGDYAGGVDHARAEEPAVEVVAAVVVVADLFFVWGVLVLVHCDCWGWDGRVWVGGKREADLEILCA